MNLDNINEKGDNTSEEGKNDVKNAKGSFNDFFLNYLYGNYNDDENIILSRGIWEDSFVKHPEIFEFAIKLTLEKKWIGYSDSLGHENVFSELEKLIKIDSEKYTKENLGLTIGNVAGLNFVFQHLRKKYKENEKKLSTLSVKPFYPSILDSITSLNDFDIKLVDSYNQNENKIFNEIEKELREGNISNILIPNFIGVDGRNYSKDFFDKLIKICEEMDIDLIIDEPTWFKKLEYPEKISSDKVIRLVSLSKMYGTAGMKMGYLIGSKEFIKEFYNTASSGYGGPLSMFFLLQEFIYNFEKNRLNGNNELEKEDLNTIKNRYKIEDKKIKELYSDYKTVIDGNYKVFLEHYGIVKKWYEKNKNLFNNGLLNENNPAINTIFEVDENIVDFKFFVSLIKLYKISVFPGQCIGNKSNTFRLNFLEEKGKLIEGLNGISDLLKKYKKRIKEDVKMIVFDFEKINKEDDLENIFDIVEYKKIKIGIVGDNREIKNFLKEKKLEVNFALIDGGDKIKNVKNLMGKMGFIDDDVIYFRENSETNDKKENHINNILLLET